MIAIKIINMVTQPQTVWLTMCFSVVSFEVNLPGYLQNWKV